MIRRSLALLAVVGVAVAQDGVRGTLETIDGRTLSGSLTVADDRAKLLTADGAVELAIAEFVSFARENAAAAPARAEHHVWLRSGHDLPVVAIAGKRSAAGAALLEIRTAGGVAVELPLGMVRALRQAGDARPEPVLFAADRQRPPVNDDLLYVVKDGAAQRSTVSITALTADRVEFLLRGEPYEFALDGVAAIVFGANTGFAPDRQPKPRTRVELVTGEAFEGRLVDVTTSAVRCRIDEGAVVEVPIARLLRLQVASDRLARLSELEPKVEQTPAFDRIWPWTVDATVAGPGFVIAGKTFANGIGLVPRTRLTYDIGGRFDRFEASIGIDDRGGPEAHAVFRVLVDGRVVMETTKTRGQPVDAVRVGLDKAKSLAIEVDFGKNYDLGDFCVFADARVVQQ